ncbi:hypothetical protein Plhal703r1_c04g0023261 [Plasmopara halstedii]
MHDESKVHVWRKSFVRIYTLSVFRFCHGDKDSLLSPVDPGYRILVLKDHTSCCIMYKLDLYINIFIVMYSSL